MIGPVAEAETTGRAPLEAVPDPTPADHPAEFGGRVMAGLTNRRESEREVFEQKPEPDDDAP